MIPEEEIKRLAIQRGAEQVGIASVAEINKYAPAGHRPGDILADAKSVIVVAGSTELKGALRSSDYRTHYANRDFPRVGSSVAMALAKFIESKYGYYSIGEIPAPTGFNPSLSQKLCAEQAGLGMRSLAAGLLLNRELGLLSLTTCVTTMPLAADGPMKEAICPHPSCVKMWEKRRTTPCLETCPECISGELEGGHIKWMRYDRRICSTRAQTHGVGVFQRMLAESVNEADKATLRNMFLGSFGRNLTQAIAANAVVGQCGECIRECPICRQARTLTPKEPGSESA